MSAMSNYLEPKVLDYIFNAAAAFAPSTVYVALHTADPTDAGNGAEVTTSGTAYARVLVNASGGASPKWEAAADNGAGGYRVRNADDITYATATADYGSAVTHVGIWDASTAGNLLFHGALTASKTVTTGDTFKFPAQNLVINIA